MTTALQKPKKSLIEMKDSDLKQAYNNSLEHVQHSSFDFYQEIQRRTQESHSKAMVNLTWAIAALTLIATIATVLGALKSH